MLIRNWYNFSRNVLWWLLFSDLWLNLLGSTILPRFLFQKWYVSGVAC